MICAPIIESDIDSMVTLANSANSDIVELRLDYLDDKDNDFSNLNKIELINKPKIITCMPEWEGGLFSCDEQNRIEILLEALNFCSPSDYVSIELKTKKEFLDKIVIAAKDKKIKVIIAHHNFVETPRKEEILKILNSEILAGADIAKVAFMPEDYGDVLTVLSVLTDNKIKIPVIAISMGEIGKISRVAGLLMGSYLTFASAAKGKESAKGQMGVDEVREVLKFFI